MSLRGISKCFGGFLANDHIDLVLRRGEVMALLGENGAGKTTLMNILSGLYQPDSGEIIAWGRPVRLRSPKDALGCGIGMVHQEFQLVETFSVVENLMLGAADHSLRLKQAAAERRIAVLARKNGLLVSPKAPIWHLAVGERQRVEILKLLYRGAELMILDEPTAVLTPHEAEDLFRTLRRLADGGKAVVVITHKLNEVMAGSDRVTVLRAGRVVASVETRATNPAELGRLMIGAEVSMPSRAVAAADAAATGVLGLHEITAVSDRGTPALRGVSLELRQGEILGVAGVAGNGQREFAEVLAGLRAAAAGRVELAGRDVTNCGVLGMLRAGLRYVPEDRRGTGLVLHLDIAVNTMLRDYRDPPFGRGPWIARGAARRAALELMQRFDVRTQRPSQPVAALSGGNQQKLVVGRELRHTPRVLVAAQPTRGLDVGAAAFIHRQLIELRRSGCGIVLISEDLDEVLRLSDRIAVMFAGRIAAVLPAEQADRARIGELMGGSIPEGRAA